MDSLLVSGVKRITRLELPLPQPITVLAGANNSGKSSLLEAIQLATAAVQAVMRTIPTWANDEVRAVVPMSALASSRLDPRSACRWGTDQPVEIKIVQQSQECRILLSKIGDTVEIALTGEALASSIGDILKPYCIYVPGLSGIPQREYGLPRGVLQQALARGDSNLVLRNVLTHLSEDGGLPLMIKDLQMVFPDCSVSVAYDSRTESEVRVSFVLQDGTSVPLESAGTGVLQCLQILSYVRLFRPQVLLLDEPDAHLHPANQRLLARVISSAVESSAYSQVIIATHSVHLMRALQPESTLYWMRNGESAVQDKAFLVPRLLELGAIDDAALLDPSRLKCVVLTEDDNKDLLRTMLWASGFESSETAVLSYGGCRNVTSLRALSGFMRDSLSTAAIVVHRDRDYLQANEVQDYISKVTGEGWDAFVTDGPDIEWYYARVEHLIALGVESATAESIVDDARLRAELKSKLTMLSWRCRAHGEKSVRKGMHVEGFGELIVTSLAEFDQQKPQMLQGKLLLAAVRALLQERGLSRIRIEEPTSALNTVALRSIASRIWPQPVTVTAQVSANPPTT